LKWEQVQSKVIPSTRVSPFFPVPAQTSWRHRVQAEVFSATAVLFSLGVMLVDTQEWIRLVTSH